jgi:hypothetical protein
MMVNKVMICFGSFCARFSFPFYIICVLVLERCFLYRSIFPRDVTTAMKRIKAEGQAPGTGGPWGFLSHGEGDTGRQGAYNALYYACMGLSNCKREQTKGQSQAGLGYVMYACAFNHMPSFQQKTGIKALFHVKERISPSSLCGVCVCALLCCHHFLLNHGGELNESLKAMLISL